MLLSATQALPDEGDLSSIVSSMSEHIEVDIDGEADVVHTGFDSGAHKYVDDVEKQISEAREEFFSVFEEMRGDLLDVFEEYVVHNARQWDQPQGNDTQEHIEWHFHEDFCSMSEHDWKGVEDILPPSQVLGVILRHWDVQRAKQLSWFPRVEKMLATAHASSTLLNHSLLSEKGFADQEWVDLMLPHLMKGYNSKKTMGNLLARCATRHASGRPGKEFMSKSYHHWYKTLRSLGIEPQYNTLLLSSLFDVSDNSQAAQDVSANQKLIMARFRRLLFLDPETSRKFFSLFSAGQAGSMQAAPISISATNDQESFVSQAMKAASRALMAQNASPHSLGTKISSVLAGLDSCFYNQDISPPVSYSEIMYQMRSELEVGQVLKDKPPTPTQPKM